MSCKVNLKSCQIPFRLPYLHQQASIFTMAFQFGFEDEDGVQDRSRNDYKSRNAAPEQPSKPVKEHDLRELVGTLS